MAITLSEEFQKAFGFNPETSPPPPSPPPPSPPPTTSDPSVELGSIRSRSLESFLDRMNAAWRWLMREGLTTADAGKLVDAGVMKPKLVEGGTSGFISKTLGDWSGGDRVYKPIGTIQCVPPAGGSWSPDNDDLGSPPYNTLFGVEIKTTLIEKKKHGVWQPEYLLINCDQYPLSEAEKMPYALINGIRFDRAIPTEHSIPPKKKRKPSTKRRKR